MKKILFIFSACSLLPIANAVPAVYNIHINGINTTPSSAQLGLIALQQNAASIASQDDFIWNLVYNPSRSDSQGIISSLFNGVSDMFKQKMSAEVINQSFTEYTVEKLNVAHLNYANGSPEYELFQASILHDYQNALVSKGGKNLQKVVDGFQQLIDPALIAQNRVAVILLPHSQGNAYANGLYNYVVSDGFPLNKITIFGFASPMPKELGILDKPDDYKSFTQYFIQNDNYITSKNDMVINNLSRLLPNGVLPANTNIPYNNNDKTGHSLIDTYLPNSEVHMKYVDFIDRNYRYFMQS